MIKHEIIIEAFDGTDWNELEIFTVTNRYQLTKEQRKQYNDLKYRCELADLQTRRVKRRELIK